MATMRFILQSRFWIFLIVAVISSRLQAQNSDVIRQLPCFDSTLKLQADSLKVSFSGQGFALVREATMAMESDYEMPVIVPLRERTWYAIVFIGEPSSRLYEVRMFDYSERQVVYQKHFGEGMESNIISYSYIPKFSEYHMIKVAQVNKKKKKNICGYIMLFKKIK